MTPGPRERSLYQHFPGGKSELVAVSTKAAGSWLRRALVGLGDQGDPSSLGAPLIDQIDQIAQDLAAHDYQEGCPVAAAAAATPSCCRAAGRRRLVRWPASWSARSKGR